MQNTPIPQSLLDLIQNAINSQTVSQEEVEQILTEKAKQKSYAIRNSLDNSIDLVIRELIKEECQSRLRAISFQEKTKQFMENEMDLTFKKTFDDYVKTKIRQKIDGNPDISSIIVSATQDYISRQIVVITEDKLNELEEIKNKYENLD
jgi:hypothetical protein